MKNPSANSTACRNRRGATVVLTAVMLVFLFAMAACVATIARTAAFQQKFSLRGMQVSASGDLNPAGLLVKPTDDRVGFSEIRIEASIDADLTEAEKAAFLDQVCQRCPLHDNVKLASSVINRLV